MEVTNPGGVDLPFGPSRAVIPLDDHISVRFTYGYSRCCPSGKPENLGVPPPWQPGFFWCPEYSSIESFRGSSYAEASDGRLSPDFQQKTTRLSASVLNPFSFNSWPRPWLL